MSYGLPSPANHDYLDSAALVVSNPPSFRFPRFPIPLTYITVSACQTTSHAFLLFSAHYLLPTRRCAWPTSFHAHSHPIRIRPLPRLPLVQIRPRTSHRRLPSCRPHTATLMPPLSPTSGRKSIPPPVVAVASGSYVFRPSPSSTYLTHHYRWWARPLSLSLLSQSVSASVLPFRIITAATPRMTPRLVVERATTPLPVLPSSRRPIPTTPARLSRTRG